MLATRTAEPLRDAMRQMLSDRVWTHFVTLAPNKPYVSIDRVKRLLRAWDAEMNRAIVGSRWTRRPDERINWFAFLEKLGPNPHWHLSLEILPHQVKKLETRVVGVDSLAITIERCWRAVARGGTADTQPITNAGGAIDYATKQLRREENFANFVSSLEFIRK